MTEVMVTPALDLRVDFNPDGSRTFIVRFAPLPLDVTQTELDAMFNRVLRAIDRQQDYYAMRELDEAVQDKIDLITQYERSAITLDEMAKIDWEAKGKKGDWTPAQMSAHDRTERQRITVALERDRAAAKAAKLKIERLLNRSKHHAPNGGPDSHAG